MQFTSFEAQNDHNHLYNWCFFYLPYIYSVYLMLRKRAEDEWSDYFIPTPFLWCSPHKRPIVRVPDKMAKIFTSLPTSPLLLQGGHDEVLCWPRSKTDLSSLSSVNILFVSPLSGPTPEILRSFQVCLILFYSKSSNSLPWRCSRVWCMCYLLFIRPW